MVVLINVYIGLWYGWYYHMVWLVIQ